MILIYQRRLILGKKNKEINSSLVSDTDSGEGYACVGVGVIGEISVPSSQFSINLKLLKNKAF